MTSPDLGSAFTGCRDCALGRARTSGKIQQCAEMNQSRKMTESPTDQGKVSIIIPCCNHGVMLCEALASVEQARNASVAEVIIVDDGPSEAETTRILNEVAEKGYRVVDQPNRGLSTARNAGIRLAKGEFILPLDSDNRLRDEYLKECFY